MLNHILVIFQGEDGFPGFKGDMGLKGDRVRSPVLLMLSTIPLVFSSWGNSSPLILTRVNRGSLECLGHVERMVLRVQKGELGPMESRVPSVLLVKK